MAGDIYYDKVSLLLPMTGSNGSTTFTDYSPSVKTVTANGNAQISTAIDAGGTGYFDGTGDYLSTPTNNAFDLGTGDFTIELRVRVGSLAAVNGLFYSGSSDSYRIQAIVNTDGKPQLYVQNTDTAFPISSMALSINTLYHLAFTRHDTLWKVYIDGIEKGSDTVSVTSPSGQPFKIGVAKTASTDRFFNGYMQDFRITKGFARYTADFTPPSPPLPTCLEPRALELYAVNQPIVQAFNPTIFNG